MNWAISLHKQHVESFLKGDKKVEVRTRVPKALRTGDWLYVIQTNSGGRVVMMLRVAEVIKMSPTELWICRERDIQVKYNAYNGYFGGHRVAYGIVIDDVVPIVEEIYREELGLSCSPQWFSLVK